MTLSAVTSIKTDRNGPCSLRRPNKTMSSASSSTPPKRTGRVEPSSEGETKYLAKTNSLALFRKLCRHYCIDEVGVKDVCVSAISLQGACRDSPQNRPGNR